MADSKVSALTGVSTPVLATAELYINDNGTSKKITLADLEALIGITTKRLSADLSNSTTTAAKVTGLDTAVGVGSWRFEYYIRYQSSVATTGIKFSVNHTGTLTAFVTNMRYVDAAATASTGAPSQAANASTAQVMGAYSARAKSTAAGIGPTLSVDTLNADMLIIIEGMMEVSVAGNIELYHASETAASTTVKAGSSLFLIKAA